MGEIKTLGILLHKTILGNDDGLLEFFTPEFGKITVSVKAFGRSAKRTREIDFFRLMELVIFQGRGSKSLRGVTTIKMFHGFNTNLELNQKGFQWLQTLRHITSEDKPTQRFFEFICKFLDEARNGDCPICDCYLRLKIIQWLGLLPDLDSELCKREKISESTVKILEFLSQSDIAGVFAKLPHIPATSLREIEEFLEKREGKGEYGNVLSLRAKRGNLRDCFAFTSFILAMATMK
ncbi:DNA repair protein RecO [Candidatus Gracilibacteria bacterium]|nr:DNA repair protein RecO [Candidatus Gracilibacteria bacterium]